MLLRSKIVTVLVTNRNSNSDFWWAVLRYATSTCTVLSFIKGQKNYVFEKKSFCVFFQSDFGFMMSVVHLLKRLNPIGWIVLERESPKRDPKPFQKQNQKFETIFKTRKDHKIILKNRIVFRREKIERDENGRWSRNVAGKNQFFRGRKW